MELPITLDQIIAIGSLFVAATVAIVNSRRNRKTDADMMRVDAERRQKISDKLDNIGSSVDETRTTVRLLDAKLDQHGTQITRLEAKLDEHERRINNMEKRCERHFGLSQHED
ncbi:hypothetical protein MKC53_04325 [[Clostridium] innocuum]|jgi:peptidoglycan hydrolase CwlO-like protein|nr:hypothetical protein [[Clostridium] innocuum]